MKLLVSGASVTVAEWHAKRLNRVAALRTPSDGNALPETMPWAADNDCFAGLNAPNYLRFVARCAEHKNRPLWITCPDKVGDMRETWRMFHKWMPMLVEVGLPVALVLQDGLEQPKNYYPLPWALSIVSAVFVGGSTAWKLSDHAAKFIHQAKAAGKLVHVGRVNSKQRIEYFARLGVDTIDGSGFSKWSNERIPLAVKWIDGAIKRRQTVMFGGNA